GFTDDEPPTPLPPPLPPLPPPVKKASPLPSAQKPAPPPKPTIEVATEASDNPFDLDEPVVQGRSVKVEPAPAPKADFQNPFADFGEAPPEPPPSPVQHAPARPAVVPIAVAVPEALLARPAAPAPSSGNPWGDFDAPAAQPVAIPVPVAVPQVPPS